MKGDLLTENKSARWPRKRVLPSLSVKRLCCLAASSSWWICAVTFLEPSLVDPGPDDGIMLGRVPSWMGKRERGDPVGDLGLTPRTFPPRARRKWRTNSWSDHVCTKLSTDHCRHCFWGWGWGGNKNLNLWKKAIHIYRPGLEGRVTARCSTHQPEANELQWEAEGAAQTRATLPWVGMCCLSKGLGGCPKANTLRPSGCCCSPSCVAPWRYLAHKTLVYWYCMLAFAGNVWITGSETITHPCFKINTTSFLGAANTIRD